MVKAAVKSFLEILEHNLLFPSHAWACLRRRRPQGGKAVVESADEHMRETADWIVRAYRATGGKGVAARYTFKEGWVSAYPETTGYIIPTLIDYSYFAKDSDYFRIAVDLAEWLMSVQLDNGGFPGGHLDQEQGPVVFNTGQILIGLLDAWRHTGDRRFFDSGVAAGRWLTGDQDPDGAWRKCTYKDRFHAYHTRVAWPLIDMGLESGHADFVEAGRKNLDFAMTLQQGNGWFAHNTLDEEEVPFTHSLAYVARGLLEGGVLLGEEKYIESARRLARPLLEDFISRGYLAGQYDIGFQPRACFSCLTGNAQMAIVWLKLYCLFADEDERFLHAARKIILQVMHCQNLQSGNSAIRGGVPGSWPVKGPYIRYGYPNWAAKFLLDALLLEKEVSES